MKKLSFTLRVGLVMVTCAWSAVAQLLLNSPARESDPYPVEVRPGGASGVQVAGAFSPGGKSKKSKTEKTQSKAGDGLDSAPNKAVAAVVPPGLMVEGRTLPEWTAEWWKWIVSLPVDRNPWFDETGEHALRGQSGSVFYLAGVVNETGTATRSVTVPADRYLLFPLINLFSFALGENPWGTIYDELYAEGLSSLAPATGLYVKVNGVAAEGLSYSTGEPVTDLLTHRERSPDFALWWPPTNNVAQAFGFDYAGISDPCLSDGFWIMLEPLPPGNHVIEFGGSFGPPSNFALGITYHLLVERVEDKPIKKPKSKSRAKPKKSKKNKSKKPPHSSTEHLPQEMDLPEVVFNLASLPRSDFWQPNGTVHAIAAHEDTVFIGGEFSALSPPHAARSGLYDQSSGTAEPDLPVINGLIHTVVGDGQGGWFLGGEFTAVGGVSRQNLVHLRGDKTVDVEWRADADEAVLTLALLDGVLYVGGSFTVIGGVARNYLAALDAVNGDVREWHPDVGVEPIKPRPIGVRALVPARGRLYIGGAFNYVGGQDRNTLAAVDLASGVVTDWQPIAFEFLEAGQVIDALAVEFDTVFVGSQLMKSVNSVTRNFAAAFDAETGILLPWDPDPDGPVLALATTCDAVFLGGSFGTIGGLLRSKLAAVDPVAAAALPWNPGADAAVRDLVLAGDTLFLGGEFNSVGGQPRSSLAAVEANSGLVSGWRPGPSFVVSAVSLSGGYVFAGGTPGGVVRHNVAALNIRTGQPLPWQPGPNGSIYALEIAPEALLLGGDFVMVDGQPRNRLAAVDLQTGRVTDWDPDVNGFERTNAVVESLVLHDDVVYVSGSFTNIGKHRRLHLAALDLQSGKVLSWNPAANGDVRTIAVDDETVFVGGRFTEVGGRPVRRLAALDVTKGSAFPWEPEADKSVRHLRILDSRLFVGGLFTSLGENLRSRLAEVEPSTGQVADWAPTVENTNLIGGLPDISYVNSMEIAEGNLFIGGRFNRIGGQARQNLAALDVSSGTVDPWNPDLDLPAIALKAFRGQLFVGGLFTTVGGQYLPYLAVFRSDDWPRITRQPVDQRVAVNTNVVMEVLANGQPPLSYQWQHNGADIPGANRPTYTIAHAQIADTGQYSVVVTNALGVINSRPVALIVLSPLRILVQPISQVASAGSTVILSVEVEGHPPPIYQWRRNGVNIPGAIEPTLVIANAQPTDGGSYSVVVANVGGAVNSDEATVVVASPALPFANDFAMAGILSGASGVGGGSNIGATQEIGEPNHAGKIGGRSVWVRWSAPADGIATFSTLGSSFDTLMGVYTGAEVAALSVTTADEDRGGFLTSQVAFNAAEGQEYHLALDGLAGTAGNIVLSWNLDTADSPVPRILAEPLSQTVFRGEDAVFEVDVFSPTPETYQWFFGCAAIEGATNHTLVVTNVQPDDVGEYSVVILNASTRVVRSVPVVLEIGPEPEFFTRDKLADLLNPPAGGGSADAGTGGSLGGFLSVALGSIEGQITDNEGSTGEPGEPSHCAQPGGVSRWFGLRPETDGVLMIDTLGSEVNTVLAVYREPTGIAGVLQDLVACDEALGRSGSVVRFDCQAGVGYAVAVDGIRADTGTIRLNWALGTAPVMSVQPPLRPVVGPGGELLLTVRISGGVPAPTYQWYLNDSLIAGATNVTLTLTNLSKDLAGTYTVTASNLAQLVWETNAVVTVGEPIVIREPTWLPGGTFGFWVEGVTGETVVIEGSTNLQREAMIQWEPLQTNGPVENPFYFEDPNASQHRRRFYRLLVP